MNKVKMICRKNKSVHTVALLAFAEPGGLVTSHMLHTSLHLLVLAAHVQAPDAFLDHDGVGVGAGAHLGVALALRAPLLHGPAESGNQRRRPVQVEGQVLERDADLVVALRVLLFEVLGVANDVCDSASAEDAGPFERGLHLLGNDLSNVLAGLQGVFEGRHLHAGSISALLDFLILNPGAGLVELLLEMLNAHGLLLVLGDE